MRAAGIGLLDHPRIESRQRLPLEPVSFSQDRLWLLNQIDPGSAAYNLSAAPVANTIWTWYQVGPHPDAGVYRALLSLARRLDTAHELWAISVKQRKQALDTGLGPSGRPLLFQAWGAAEMAVIALHRAVRLAGTLARWLDVEVPTMSAGLLGRLSSSGTRWSTMRNGPRAWSEGG